MSLGVLPLSPVSGPKLKPESLSTGETQALLLSAILSVLVLYWSAKLLRRSLFAASQCSCENWSAPTLPDSPDPCFLSSLPICPTSLLIPYQPSEVQPVSLTLPWLIKYKFIFLFLRFWGLNFFGELHTRVPYLIIFPLPLSPIPPMPPTPYLL